MSLNKLLIIFGIILAIFVGVVFFQFSSKSSKNKITGSSVTINNHTFKIETAKTPKELQDGLSGRESLPQDQGMLFIFEKSDYYNFWMKNMKFPLDIVFIKDDKIVSIVKNATPPKSSSDNPEILKPDGVINRVLEINAGLSDKYKFEKGDKVEVKLSN